MRIGGRVEWLLEPATPDEFVAAWHAARERGYEPRVLGGGANLLVEDGVLPGVVITTARMKRIFRPSATTDEALDQDPSSSIAPRPRGEDPRLVAWCGTTLPSLVSTARDLGWSGLEGIVGVPGHVGGGVAMNAGGRWGELWDVIELVRVIDREGELRDLARAECSPRYRNWGLEGMVALGAVFRLEVQSVGEVRARGAEYLREKRRVQPVTEWSCGCIFKNPDPELSDGRSAGKLIDDCGGKVLSRGDAIVSPLHANFIVNTRAATAADVTTLIEDVRDLVRERSGVELEREVRIWRAAELANPL